MDTTIFDWMTMLLEKNGLNDERELTAEMIAEEIDEIQAAIKNEELCALGSPTPEAHMLHAGNIGMMGAYIKHLQSMVTDKD